MSDRANLPRSVAEAELMQKVGFAYLAEHAKEKLTNTATAALRAARLAALEEAAVECEKAPTRWEEWYSSVSSRPLECDMADWLAARIRSLKEST